MDQNSHTCVLCGAAGDHGTFDPQLCVVCDRAALLDAYQDELDSNLVLRRRARRYERLCRSAIVILAQVSAGHRDQHGGPCAVPCRLCFASEAARRLAGLLCPPAEP